MNNVISENIGLQWGGGIHMGKYVVGTMMGNLIDNNESEAGGGVFCGGEGGASNTTWIDNLILKNSASNIGGGVWVHGSNTKAAFVNNTILNNSALNNGGGVACSHSLYTTMDNSICWGNNAQTGKEMWIVDNATLSVSYSDVEGYHSTIYVETGSTLNWGMGMIDSDPLFVDPANGDFHITFNSPCRGSGDNKAVLDSHDFEGDPRIAYGTVDMGADEFYTHLYWMGDATPGGNVELKFVGLPGTSPIQLWLGSGVMDPPLPTKYGDWYLQFPLLVQLALGSIPAPDGVYILPFTFPPDTPTPLSLPFQAGIGTELTNLCVLEVE